MDRIVYGIRPSGDLHIGNYLGAILQWIELQKSHECLFFIADLHAITTPYDPDLLQKNIKATAIAYLSAGLNPESCVIFVQSHIPAHTELAWILSTITQLGDLKRMTQFKEKAKKYKKNVNAGLLNYPVLMAADILLYKPELVPVGKDQQQHLELTRSLARKFNRKFGKVFPEPKAHFMKEGAKIMSLQNPKVKMSKSEDPKGAIGLFESPESIKDKIMSALTDSGQSIVFSPHNKPGISNLLTIYSLFSKQPISVLERKFKNAGYAFFKKSLANLLIKELEPFRKKYKEYSTRDVYLEQILKEGAKKASSIAQSTLLEVKQKMGLI